MENTPFSSLSVPVVLGLGSYSLSLVTSLSLVRMLGCSLVVVGWGLLGPGLGRHRLYLMAMTAVLPVFCRIWEAWRWLDC